MRVLLGLTELATTGQGDLLPLHGPLAGAMRLRVGPWRVTLRLPKPASVHVLAIEKRGDAYR
jgi:mRNA-degrading endonuclease RelE of RelBE toxin-antitoxin system